jgi:hypothetical protein
MSIDAMSDGSGLCVVWADDKCEGWEIILLNISYRLGSLLNGWLVSANCDSGKHHIELLSKAMVYFLYAIVNSVVQDVLKPDL